MEKNTIHIYTKLNGHTPEFITQRVTCPGCTTKELASKKDIKTHILPHKRFGRRGE